MSPELQAYRERHQRTLADVLQQNDSQRLLDAMRYSVLDGGKRIRGLLVFAAAEAVGAPVENADIVAAAIECVHCYSLIHDDLPAMDDDELRRGRATNHIQFDEATAILAGDGLLTLSLNLLNSPSCPLNDTQARTISYELSQAAGAQGMVAGQMLDIIATNQDLSLTELENIHRLKTGAMIEAAVVCGAYCQASVASETIEQLRNFARCIGLAFQVVDDILDIESSTEALGKKQGADLELGKSTYPKLLGLDKSKQLAENLYQQAIASIATISDNSQLLLELANLIVKRNH